MAKVLLISCNITQEPYPVYPLGMSMVAEAVREHGHEVHEWDINVQGKDAPSIQAVIRQVQPHYVGLSLRNVDSANYNKPDAYITEYKNVVAAIRQVTTAPIILGGSAYTIFPDLILKELGADHGVAGEGEKAFCSLLDQLETDPDSAYPIYYNNPALSGSEFSTSKRNELLTDFYLKNGGMLNVQTKRGCPHRCAYCSYPLLEGKKYRLRPPVEVAHEFEELTQKYHADYIAITDSVFNDAGEHYLRIAEELVRRQISTPWMCFLRPDDFQKDQVDLLVRAGLKAVEWGSDCATDTTLQAMHKDFTWNQVVHSNNLFAQHGVSNAHFIIFGGPGETEATLDQGLINLQSLTHCVIFAGIGVRIFPGTAVHRWALEEGKITPDQNLLPPIYYFSDKVDRAVMHDKILASFARRMDRI
ncbi:MAG: radical SAM protein, partial [Calditrichaeota bacterium]